MFTLHKHCKMSVGREQYKAPVVRRVVPGSARTPASCAPPKSLTTTMHDHQGLTIQTKPGRIVATSMVGYG